MAAEFRPKVRTQLIDFPTAGQRGNENSSSSRIKCFNAQLPGEYSCLLTGITCSHGAIIVCDNETKNVKRFHFSGKLIDKLTLEDPCGICTIPKSVDVVITEPDVYKISFCSLDGQLSLTSKSKTSKKYECIAAMDEVKLVVGCCSLGSSCVDVIDVNGTVLRSIQSNKDDSKLFRNPSAITCLSSGELLISDPGSSLLVCISPEGELQFQYDPCGRPSGICVDAFGLIYMAQYDSSTVFRLSPDGKKESILMVDQSLEIKSPLAMSLNDSHLVLTEEMPSNRVILIKLAAVPERQATGLSLSNVRIGVQSAAGHRSHSTLTNPVMVHAE